MGKQREGNPAMNLFIQLGELTGSTSVLPSLHWTEHALCRTSFILKIAVATRAGISCFLVIVSLLQQLVNSTDGWTNGRKKKERRRVCLVKEAVLFFSYFFLLFKCLSKGIGF